VLIDRTHRPWFIGTAFALAVSSVLYIFYAVLSVRGPSGGSVPGLIYGSLGSALMLFAGLLGLRKKFPVWRVGRGTSWMRGHLWLGFLSFPLILFHAAFRLGNGSLTRAMMVLFIIVFVSGIFGAVLQNYMPRIMTERVPMETIYEQIERVRGQLTDEAGVLINELTCTLRGEMNGADESQRTVAASAGSRIGVTFASATGADEGVGNALQEFFDKQLKPFLMQSGGHGRALDDPDTSAGMFQQLHVLIPNQLWQKLEDLESICEEKRQLDRQKWLHKLLHGWLLVHIPASYALLLMGAVHAVIALRY
jgi:hypothetical protein